MMADHNKMAVGEKEIFGKIVQGVEASSQLITRYTFLAILYIGPSTSARDELEMAFIRLCSKVLVYLIEAKCYFQTSTESMYAYDPF